MQVKLCDVPDTLFDKIRWEQFCGRFVSKEAALVAISRPPFGRYGYHGDSEDCLPASAEQKAAHAEATFELGNELIGRLKQSLVSGELKSTGVVFHLQYQRGEEEPVDIAGEEWKRMWPEFLDNRAFGNGRYENVRITWDARKSFKAKTLEDMILHWLMNECPDACLKKKVQLSSDAHERFGDVPVRVFNRAYGRAFKRKRGAPRRSK